MLIRQLLLIIPIAILATSCGRSQCCNDIVCETYVHPYGLAVSSDEWCRQGACGEVITTRKDGVVVKRSFQSGVVDGQVTETFPHRETLESTKVYSRGKVVKECHNYSSGSPRVEIEHVAPNEQIVKSYYDQGTLKSVEYQQGNRIAKGTYYNLAEAVESSVEDFNGKSTKRDIYGQLLSVDTIEDGVVASSTTYHINAMPDAITPYKNGVIHGSRKTFLPGGEPYTIEEWQAGQQHGMMQHFQDGEKVAETPFFRGNREGVERHFRGDEVVEEISWHAHRRHGPTNRYIEGQVVTDWYFNGTAVTKAIFDKRAALLQPTH